MIDLAGFNERAVASSDNFLIAAAPLDAVGLAERIGTAASGAIDATIADALAGAGSGAHGDKPRAVAVLDATDTAFSYSVRLADFGDEALRGQLSEVLSGVVTVLARHLPLSSLDGFTLAADYPAALAGLDRGGGLPPEQTSALGYGTGVGMTVDVVRDCVAKKHVVLGAGVALSWLDETEATRAGALNILVKMLAYVAHDAGYRDQLDAARFEPDVITAMLHPAIGACPRGWYSARESAFVAPDIGDAYATLVLEALVYGRSAMAEARLRFAEDQDIAALVGTAIECASAVLAHAADWLGHRAGLAEDSAFAGSDLPGRLLPWDLADWIELFGRDLAAIYETADGRIDVARAISISPHFERILWTIGVLAWPDSDSVQWLAVDPGPAPPSAPIEEEDANGAQD